MSRKKSDPLEVTANFNGLVYDYYFNMFYELAMNRFKWINLPDNIPPRFVEQTLCDSGYIIFFYDKYLTKDSINALGGTYHDYDVYWNPTRFNVIGGNGYFNSKLTTDDSVIVWNNYTRTSDLDVIEMFAMSMYDLYVASLVNSKAQKTPVIIEANSEDEKLTLKNAYMKVDGNQPVIFAKGNTIRDSIHALNVAAPFVAKELYDVKDRIQEEFLKWAGVKVPPMYSRERVTEKETTDYNAVTWQLRNRGLQSRQDGIKQINKKWGCNLEIEFNEELKEEVKMRFEGGLEDE